MNSGSRPCAPRYFDETASAAPWPSWRRPRPAQHVAAAAAHARGDRGVVPDQLRDHALDGPAGRELDDDERKQHDPEQRRDDQQQCV